MKAARDRGWTGIAGLFILVAALAGLAAHEFSKRENRRAGDRGSLFTGDSSGARALFLVLRAEGLSVEALTRPPTAAMAKGLLLVIDPDATLDESRATEIKAWIGAGGAALVAGEDFGALGTALGVKIRPARERGLGLALPVGTALRLALATGSDAGIDSEEEVTRLAKRSKRTQVAELVSGSGRVLFVADGFCATNGALDLADNAAWWVATSKRLAAGRPVMFLETVHGHLREPSVLEYVTDHGYGAASLQALLVLGAALWLFGARPAPPLAASSLVRRPVAEHAATMAHLYSRGRTERHAVKVALAEMEAWLRRPAWARISARLTAADRAAAELESSKLILAGRGLAEVARPNEDAAFGWIAKAARFRRRFCLDDGE